MTKMIDGKQNPWLGVADKIQENPSCALFYQGEPYYFVASLKDKEGHKIKDKDDLISNELPLSDKDEYNLITCIPPEPWQSLSKLSLCSFGLTKTFDNGTL